MMSVCVWVQSKMKNYEIKKTDTTVEEIEEEGSCGRRKYVGRRYKSLLLVDFVPEKSFSAGFSQRSY